MAIDIPWIGYREEMKYQGRALREAGFNVELTDDMKSGLTLLQGNVYPVIIVQDWLSTGGLELPHRVLTRDPTEITQYFLTQIRLLPDYMQKPVIIPHFLSRRPGNLERLQINDLVDLVEMLHPKSLNGCIVEAVRRHL